MELKSVFISGMAPGGCGFGHLEDGERVFVPSSIVNAYGLQIGDTAEGVVVPNASDHSEHTPWQLVGRPTNRVVELVDQANTPDDPAQIIESSRIPVTEERVLKYVLLLDRVVHTTGSVCKAFEVTDPSEAKIVSNALMHAHKAGKLTRADVTSKRGLKPTCYYASKPKVFEELLSYEADEEKEEA